MSCASCRPKRNDAERLTVSEDGYRLDFETYDQPAPDAPYRMCSLARQKGGHYLLRVQDGLSFKYIGRQPSYNFSLDPFTLLPEDYWPLLMDFVLEVEP